MAATKQRGVLDLDLSVRVPVPVAQALAVLVLGLTSAYIFLPTFRPDIEFFAIALTAAAGIGSSFYLAEGLWKQLEQQKKAEAFALISRWNSPDLFHARRAWNRISDIFQMRPGGGPAAVKALLLDPKQERVAANIRYMLNFLEELAVAIKEQHGDREFLKEAFQGIVVRAHDALSEWIEEHRLLTGRQDIWEQFDILYGTWQKR